MSATYRIGGEVRVNTATEGNQVSHVVATLKSGGWVAAWTDGSFDGPGGDGSGQGIKAQAYTAGGVPLGGEVAVNQATADDQFSPRIIALKTVDRYVVVWTDSSLGEGGATGDADGLALKGRVYEANGTPVTAEFLVPTALADDQYEPEIVALDGGGFVVVWQDLSSGSASVRAQVFDDNGGKLGPVVSVKGGFSGAYFSADVTALDGGGFAVAWIDFSASRIRSQAFNNQGQAVGGEIAVGATNVGNRANPEIVALDGGGYAVAWTDDLGDGSSDAVKARAVSAANVALGSEILVNTATQGAQGRSGVTALNGGGFVVTWNDASAGVGGATGDTVPNAVKAQVYTSSGVAVGGEILVNTAVAGNQNGAQVLALTGGGFVAAWEDGSAGVGGAGGDTSGSAVKAQVFSNAGVKLGGEFLVNTAVNRTQYEVQLTERLDGGFVAVWADDSRGVGGAGGDTSGVAVKAQAFARPGNPVTGGSGADPLVGTAGDDVVTPGGGNDSVSAGTGFDVVVLNSAFASTTVTVRARSVTTSGADGVDTISGVERFVFTDRTIDRDSADGVDDLFYLATYADARDSGLDADVHFAQVGLTEGRAPNALFDRAYYLASNPDVAAAGVDPWLHFIGGGWAEGRDPSAAFNTRAYWAANPDVQAAGINPLLHFLASGADEGRARSLLFDEAGYLATYTDVAAAGTDPLAHYFITGWRSGRDPSTGFDTSQYLDVNVDVAAADVNPLLHWLIAGRFEGRAAYDDGVWG